jgi:nucleoside-diphosphate-sugar epimerase
MRGIVAGAVACGARIVYADNLYAYGPVWGPLTEDLASHATGPNGRVRAVLAEDLMGAHVAGTVRATIGRASDYFGPRGLQSMAGERLFGRAVAGKPAQLLGNPDVPHTLTYLPDFGRALVTLGTREEALGHVWHVPSAETLTSREFAALVFEALGRPLKLQVMSSALLAVAALFSPTVRAVREQGYQRDAPWIVDHSKFARAFGVDVTPIVRRSRARRRGFRGQPDVASPDRSAHRIVRGAVVLGVQVATMQGMRRLRVTAPCRLPPAQFRGYEPEDAFDGVGVVLDAELVRDR